MKDCHNIKNKWRQGNVHLAKQKNSDRRRIFAKTKHWQTERNKYFYIDRAFDYNFYDCNSSVASLK